LRAPWPVRAGRLRLEAWRHSWIRTEFGSRQLGSPYRPFPPRAWRQPVPPGQTGPNARRMRVAGHGACRWNLRPTPSESESARAREGPPRCPFFCDRHEFGWRTVFAGGGTASFSARAVRAIISPKPERRGRPTRASFRQSTTFFHVFSLPRASEKCWLTVRDRQQSCRATWNRGTLRVGRLVLLVVGDLPATGDRREAPRRTMCFVRSACPTNRSEARCRTFEAPYLDA